MREEIC